MDDLASTIAAIAAVVSVVAGIITARRRQTNWRWRSAGQFGFAVVLVLASVSIRAHSPALDLVLAAAGLSMLGVTIYSARRPSTPAS